MGTWGTGLFDNDLAKDIRGDYMEKLGSGKSAGEASREMIESNIPAADDEEEALFWLSLAAIQWEYGRLQPDVKEKALGILLSGFESDRWREAGGEKAEKWEETLSELKGKLLSDQPPEKTIRKRKRFICSWEPGAVFAYRFEGEYSKEKGFFHQFFVFRKVSEGEWHPHHIIPIIEVYNWIGKEAPAIEEIRSMGKLPNPFSRMVGTELRAKYQFEFVLEAENRVPKEQLTILGVIGGEDLAPLRKGFLNGVYPVSPETSKDNWKIEKTIIDQFMKWNMYTADGKFMEHRPSWSL